MVILTNDYLYYRMELIYLKCFSVKNPKESFLKRLKTESLRMKKQQYIDIMYFYKKCYQSLFLKFNTTKINTPSENFLNERMKDIEIIIKKNKNLN